MSKKLKLFGKEYVFIGEGKTGAIATQEEYENFEESYAYLFKDGTIKRHYQKIGTIDDIEWIEEKS